MSGDPLERAIDLRQRGVYALKQGEREQARQLLSEAVRLNAQDEEAWYWLGSSLDDPAKQRECFARALSINPHSQRTLDALTTLNAPPAPAPALRPPEYYSNLPPPPQPQITAQPAQMPAKKSMSAGRMLATVALSVLLVLACIIGLGNKKGASSSNFTFTNSSTTRSVVYEVTGTASYVDLTIENAGGNTEQMSERLPWKKTMSMRSGSFVYVSAQNTGSSGSVTCKITADGQTIETATSSGAYKIASCSGSVP